MVKGFFRSPRSILRRTAHTKCGMYLLASSLAAALLTVLLSILLVPRIAGLFNEAAGRLRRMQHSRQPLSSEPA